MRLAATSFNFPATSLLRAQGAFVGESLFWLYYIRKDCGRLSDLAEFNRPEKFQKKIIISGKVVGDICRLAEVIGRNFSKQFYPRHLQTTKAVGLSLGAMDALNEQIFKFKEIKEKGATVQRVSDLFSSIFFGAFSVASLADMQKKLEGYSQPKHLIGLMVLSIVCSMFSSIFNKKRSYDP
ncbi:MAG: hypothetical protein ACOYK9_00300 [Chlamydiia bacterium]